MDLSLDFVNTGSKPIIILRPPLEMSPACSGRRSGIGPDEGGFGGANIYLPRTSLAFFYGKAGELAGQLDQATPPAGLTRIIQPKETWEWSTQVGFYLGPRAANTGWRTNIGWDEVGRVNRPVWVASGRRDVAFRLERLERNLFEAATALARQRMAVDKRRRHHQELVSDRSCSVK